MAYKQEVEAPNFTLSQRLWNGFKSLLHYPFRMAKKMESYNKGLSDLISVKNEPNPNGADDYYFRNFQRKNTKLIFMLIYLPIILSFVGTLAVAYWRKDNYINYYTNLTAPVNEEKFTRTVSAYVRKMSYAIRNQPVTSKEAMPLIGFYLLALIGARFVSYNPVFKIEDEIRRRLTALNCVDIDGNPWKIVWTPEALLIVAFARDPHQLAADAKFWATINFPPSTPKQSKKDMNKFVVQRKYELSSNMIFKLNAADLNEKQ